MRQIVLVVLAALVLGACTTTGPSPYGNYLNAAAVDQQKLAGDAVKQLAVLWPPAKTRLALQQPTPDAFGTALVKALRESGYALAEFTPEAAKVKNSEAPAPTTSAGQPLPLRYVLDQAGTTNLYRLTLAVGSQSITRPYQERNGALVPTGYWVRKE